MKFSVLIIFTVLILLSGCTNKKIDKKAETKKALHDIEYYQCVKIKKIKNKKPKYIVTDIAVNFSAIKTNKSKQKKLNSLMTEYNLKDCWENKKKKSN